MDTQTLEHFKHKLTEELSTVEGQLSELGVQNESGEWETSAGDIDETATEQDELSDRMEDFEERDEELQGLKVQARNIKRALLSIEDGSYGICEVGGEEIERDRLEVSPSARTCTAHMNEEDTLGN